MKAKYRGFDVAVKQMLTYDINDPNFDEEQRKAVLQSYQDLRHNAALDYEVSSIIFLFPLNVYSFFPFYCSSRRH
jgi:hypothetical protein